MRILTGVINNFIYIERESVRVLWSKKLTLLERITTCEDDSDSFLKTVSRRHLLEQWRHLQKEEEEEEKSASKCQQLQCRHLIPTQSSGLSPFTWNHVLKTNEHSCMLLFPNFKNKRKNNGSVRTFLNTFISCIIAYTQALASTSIITPLDGSISSTNICSSSFFVSGLLAMDDVIPSLYTCWLAERTFIFPLPPQTAAVSSQKCFIVIHKMVVKWNWHMCFKVNKEDMYFNGKWIKWQLILQSHRCDKCDDKLWANQWDRSVTLWLDCISARLHTVIKEEKASAMSRSATSCHRETGFLKDFKSIKWAWDMSFIIYLC